MQKMELTYNNVKEAILNKGYSFFEGHYDINIVGIRTNTKKVNEWDDYLCLLYQIDGTNVIHVFNDFTTDPGRYYLQKKLLNPKGCFILAEGQYKGIWKMGKHGKNQYRALVQTGGKVTGYRDRDMDNELDFDSETLDTGYFGINFHHGYESDKVEWNSAGCQVFRYSKELTRALDIIQESMNLYGEKVSYTLLNEEDVKKATN